MKAITVAPGAAGSVRLDDVPEPPDSEGSILVEAIALGVCGTDHEILSGAYGAAPDQHERLVIGHESLGRVLEAPVGSGFRAGDLVVGIVRLPDPVPCEQCGAGEWDMCSNGLYTEHGIKGRHGFGRERFRLNPSHAVRVEPALGPRGVLLEPASVVAKAWDQITRIGARARWTPRRVLVLGAGPVGLLAALFARLRDLEVHVFDRVQSGPKPALVASLHATYHTGPITDMDTEVDVVLECTGAAGLLFDAVRRVAPNGIACLTGVSSGSRVLSLDAGAVNNELVLQNNVVFGTVNANRLHYTQAADALARSDRSWLDRLITRRIPLDRWREAFDRAEGGVKTVLEFQSLGSPQ
jgi:threonine dehydrogenase-like Zn-dependent dehydrogenase